ncbi:hypothetical protein ACFOYW_15940 [Gryllotalpicola reticulitermitis]|uniref:Uncharacterized protein n=1 Tax=Gryllotalpicola reticulitermitis TaxID=1184153 RepID=A0ABV8QBN3_9MICO
MNEVFVKLLCIGPDKRNPISTWLIRKRIRKYCVNDLAARTHLLADRRNHEVTTPNPVHPFNLDFWHLEIVASCEQARNLRMLDIDDVALEH